VKMPFQAYESGEYLSKNPTWDIEDSAWKANEVLKIIKKNNLAPKNLVEVGCGAGGILASLQDARPDIEYSGYEIASSAETFWEAYKSRNIAFKIEDFLHAKTPHFDTLLLLDVIEHLPNPFDFMSALRGRSDNYILHIPLDLSAVSVTFETPLLKVRSKVGHIHYFTKGLALSLLHECGYEIVDWHYTGASFHAPQTSWKTRLARLPRRVAYAINRDMGVRLLGGDTLMVLVRSRND
jgi:cyclopropane fatty-acyl-phospholipid synthase-like methyltransferase